MTSQIITVANTAGGTGKSTTAHALAIAFSEYGKRTLLVDGDPNSSLSYLLGAERVRQSLFDVLRASASLESAVITTAERFTFLPSDSRLSHLTIREVNDLVDAFRRQLASFDNPFDIIVIDAPSTISPALAFTLGSADCAIAPFLPNSLGLRGILAAMEVASAKSLKRNTVTWLGALPILTYADPAEIHALVQRDLPVLETSIPRSSEVIQALSLGKSVLTTSPGNSASIAYREIAYFLLEQITGL